MNLEGDRDEAKDNVVALKHELERVQHSNDTLEERNEVNDSTRTGVERQRPGPEVAPEPKRRAHSEKVLLPPGVTV